MALIHLLARLGADINPFRRKMDEATAYAKKAGTNMARGLTLGRAFAAGSLVTGVVGFAKNILTAADNIQDLADQMDLSTTEIQKLTFTLNDAGLEFNRFATVFDRVAALRERASEGDQKAIELLGRLKISQADVNDENLRTLDLVQRIAAARGDRTTMNEAGGKGAARVFRALDKGQGTEPWITNSEVEIRSASKQVAMFSNLWASAKAATIKLFSTGVIGGRFRDAAEGELLNEKLIDINAEKLKSRTPSPPTKSFSTVGQYRAMLASDEEDRKYNIEVAKKWLEANQPGKAAIFSDALTSVGNFAGGSTKTGTLTGLANQQLRELKEIRRQLTDFVENNGTNSFSGL